MTPTPTHPDGRAYTDRDADGDGNTDGDAHPDGSADGDAHPDAHPTPTPGGITFTGSSVRVDTLSPSDPNYNQPTVFFAGAGAAFTPQSFTAQQTNNVGGFTVDATACSGIATVTPSSGTTFTVTAVSVGICRLDVTGSGGPPTPPPTPIYVSITAAAFTVN